MIHTTFDEWYKKYNFNLDTVNAIYYLQQVRPYTDEEIIEAIDEVSKIAAQCEMTICDVVRLIVGNELFALRTKEFEEIANGSK